MVFLNSSLYFVGLFLLDMCVFPVCFFLSLILTHLSTFLGYIQYVVESRFQKPDYKKPKENTLLNNRIGNYLTSDFADLPSVDTDNIIDTEYDCTAAGKEENNAAEN